MITITITTGKQVRQENERGTIQDRTYDRKANVFTPVSPSCRAAERLADKQKQLSIAKPNYGREDDIFSFL